MDIAKEIADSMPLPEGKEDMGGMSAADDILAAIKGNDSKKLNEALKAHWRMCEASEYEGD